ncbi:hypothetical protein WJX81_001792 [Elliptochloris bilobata]|uniref:TPX2 C-terminal domain-containing protein n=1 Tax=Elliptochloris bilobata TaxID=381761 RepID=A0AAW1QW57_9CHLO
MGCRHNQVRLGQRWAGDDGAGAERHAAQARRFAGFLARQQAYERAHRERVEAELRSRPWADGALGVAPGSRRILQRRRGDDDSPGPAHAAVRRSLSAPPTAQSFSPRISERAKALPARSRQEMSVGDRVRREAALERARAAAAAEAERALTFRPRTLARAGAVARVDTSHPEAYRERLRQRAASHSARIAQRQEEDLQQCTFKPQTGQLPAFISRMARSYAREGRTRSAAVSSKRGWL